MHVDITTASCKGDVARYIQALVSSLSQRTGSAKVLSIRVRTWASLIVETGELHDSADMVFFLWVVAVRSWVFVVFITLGQNIVQEPVQSFGIPLIFIFGHGCSRTSQSRRRRLR